MDDAGRRNWPRTKRKPAVPGKNVVTMTPLPTQRRYPIIKSSKIKYYRRILQAQRLVVSDTCRHAMTHFWLPTRRLQLFVYVCVAGAFV